MFVRRSICFKRQIGKAVPVSFQRRFRQALIDSNFASLGQWLLVFLHMDSNHNPTCSSKMLLPLLAYNQLLAEDIHLEAQCLRRLLSARL